MQQLLMAENKSVRLVLVEVLAQIQGREATQAPGYGPEDLKMLEVRDFLVLRHPGGVFVTGLPRASSSPGASWCQEPGAARPGRASSRIRWS